MLRWKLSVSRQEVTELQTGNRTIAAVQSSHQQTFLLSPVNHAQSKSMTNHTKDQILDKIMVLLGWCVEKTLWELPNQDCEKQNRFLGSLRVCEASSLVTSSQWRDLMLVTASQLNCVQRLQKIQPPHRSSFNESSLSHTSALLFFCSLRLNRVSTDLGGARCTHLCFVTMSCDSMLDFFIWSQSVCSIGISSHQLWCYMQAVCVDMYVHVYGVYEPIRVEARV